MKLRTLLWAAVLSMAALSCVKDEPGTYTLVFETNEFTAAFYTQGETPPITEIARFYEADNLYNFNLIERTEGVDIWDEVPLVITADNAISYTNAAGNAQARIEWTKMLPLGENTVNVTAAIGDKTAAAELTVNNRFQGTFPGTYDVGFGLQNVTLIFNYAETSPSGDDSGTVDVTDPALGQGTGTWTRSGSNITTTYNFGGTDITLQGILTYDIIGAFISGDVYDLNDNDVGDFNVEFQ